MDTSKDIRERVKQILVNTCGQECSNGSEKDYRAVDSILQVFKEYIEEKKIPKERNDFGDLIYNEALIDLLEGLEKENV